MHIPIEHKAQYLINQLKVLVENEGMCQSYCVFFSDKEYVNQCSDCVMTYLNLNFEKKD